MNYRYEIFLKAAELRSFTRTAEYFQYTQSAVSQTVKSLENELGVTLFLRARGGLVLSSEGEQLYPTIREIVRKERELEDEVSKLHDMQGGTVRLGAYHSVSCHWLPKCLRAFQGFYPNIRFELYQEDDIHLFDLLSRGVLDLLIVSDPGKREYEHERLFSDPFVLLLPKGHALAGRERVSSDMLDGESLIYIEGGYGRYVRQMFRGGHGRPRSRFNMIEDNAVMAMVEQGFGIGIAPLLTTRRMPYELTVIPLQEGVSREIDLVRRHGDVGTWATRTFRRFAVAYAGECDGAPSEEA